MAAQIPDTVVFENEVYSLIGVAGEGLPSPQQFGMQPVRVHVAF